MEVLKGWRSLEEEGVRLLLWLEENLQRVMFHFLNYNVLMTLGFQVLGAVTPFRHCKELPGSRV